jgi:Pyruvate/2-oxoacid:ferredoxin oxidoreductase delta subunit
MGWEWKLIQRECTGCGICADVCAQAAIEMTREAAYPRQVLLKCAGCMVCVEECPFCAIELHELSSA